MVVGCVDLAPSELLSSFFRVVSIAVVIINVTVIAIMIVIVIAGPSFSCTDSLVVKDPISDAGGPRFESHAGRVTGKPAPSLWRDKHPAIKGLRPPESRAGQFHPVPIRPLGVRKPENKKGARQRIPFGDHPLDLERYNGPCARMTRTDRDAYGYLQADCSIELV